MGLRAINHIIALYSLNQNVLDSEKVLKQVLGLLKQTSE